MYVCSHVFVCLFIYFKKLAHHIIVRTGESEIQRSGWQAKNQVGCGAVVLRKNSFFGKPHSLYVRLLIDWVRLTHTLKDNLY